MPHVSPFPLLRNWLDRHAVAGSGSIICSFDDVMDIFRGIIVGVPVDEAYYTQAYPSVARRLVSAGFETLHGHYYKHGYFEGRRPFETGWKQLEPPMPFAEIMRKLSIIPCLGRLEVEFGRAELMKIISEVLRSVPVHEAWYFEAYPAAEKAVRDKKYGSASDHYCQQGYFEALLPQQIVVDSDWYVGRYEHVRNGLTTGVASSAQDHFVRIGYAEGCRPTQP